MLRLLTAFVDGELSERRCRKVGRLLRHSAKARELVGQLRADAAQLANLPRRKLERDLAQRLRQIPVARPAQPAVPHFRSSATAGISVARLACVVALCAVIIVASYVIGFRRAASAANNRADEVAPLAPETVDARTATPLPASAPSPRIQSAETEQAPTALQPEPEALPKEQEKPKEPEADQPSATPTPTAETNTAPAVSAQPSQAGSPASLSVLPDRMTLTGADRVQQLIVTARYGDGTLRDVGAEATYRFTDAKVARVGERGMVLPLANGTTRLTVESQGRTAEVAVTVRGMEREQPINFATEIIPVLSKLGCNSGACHGSAAGQAGFKLSLMASDPAADYDAIAHQARGRRVFPAAPERSLLLLKPTGAVGHGGVKRMEVGSAEHQLLVRWIRSGMPWGSKGDPQVVRITLEPQEQRLLPRRAHQQLVVTAHYSDGTTQDITRLAEYTNNNEELFAISKNGLVETSDLPGAGSILAKYQGHIAVFRATIPTGNVLEKFPQPNNFVDEKVFARLRQLGIVPSELCSDSEFIRRACLDITGSLPTQLFTPAEVEKFLADADPKKRDQLVATLLDKPEYSKYFALRWTDLLRNKRGNVNDPHCLTRPINFHNWIRDSLQQNKPYDQFVRAILTAVGEPVGANANPPAAWYTQVLDAKLMADDTAQVFLGTQINCAQCHHHPYEKWTQDDYWHFAAFFARVDRKTMTGRFNDTTQSVSVKSAGSVTPTQGPAQGRAYSVPRPLDGAELAVPSGQDPRHKLVDWMVRPDNPFFARALVNRYWGHFLGRGIVDPVDDMRVTNPPSNPELLKALEQDFIEHKFDLKHLIRTICASKTYQLSSVANAQNKNDMQNYSRHIPKRLQAEVLLDAIDQAVGSTSAFVTPQPKTSDGKAMAEEFSKVHKRAIDLPIVEITAPYFLDVFDKPQRSTVSECERPSDATLDQSVFLLNSGEIQHKLAAAGSRPAKLAADSRADADKIKELYLLCYARTPTPKEVDNLKKYLASRRRSVQTRQQAYEDILWAMINTKEFMFNH
jgi:hypothetical protein